MILRVVSSHPKLKDKRERMQSTTITSLDKICRSIRGISGKHAYELKRDKRIVYTDDHGWTHEITIEEGFAGSPAKQEGEK